MSRRPLPILRSWVAAPAFAILVALSATVAAVGYLTIRPDGDSGSASPAVAIGPPAPCLGNDPNVSDPSGPRGLFVLDPPTSPSSAGFQAVDRYLINGSVACGVDFWVHWSDVDHGPGASPRYDWSSVRSEMAPWVAAGKEVNLIFWAVGYGANATYVPSSILAGLPKVQCGGSPVTPYFWTSAYQSNYSTFIRAAVAEFASDRSIGYLRFGLGTGGETFPLYDINHPGCHDALNATGFTVAIWDQYLQSMIAFEGGLGSPHPLMVALDGGYGGATDHTFSDIASWAVANGLGFGSEAITRDSVSLDGSGAPVCNNGGFCSLFQQYQGRVPLEIQTQGPSEPDGSAPIGSLVPIVSYTLAEHTQILELYTQDWLIAFDPAEPGYGAYHTAYAESLEAAAAVVG